MEVMCLAKFYSWALAQASCFCVRATCVEILVICNMEAKNQTCLIILVMNDQMLRVCGKETTLLTVWSWCVVFKIKIQDGWFRWWRYSRFCVADGVVWGLQLSRKTCSKLWIMKRPRKISAVPSIYLDSWNVWDEHHINKENLAINPPVCLRG